MSTYYTVNHQANSQGPNDGHEGRLATAATVNSNSLCVVLPHKVSEGMPSDVQTQS